MRQKASAQISAMITQSWRMKNILVFPQVKAELNKHFICAKVVEAPIHLQYYHSQNQM